jgi:hypothetical protein
MGRCLRRDANEMKNWSLMEWVMGRLDVADIEVLEPCRT